MLVPFDKVSNQFELDLEKLKNILSIQKSTPEELKTNTVHLSNMATVFPYTYYTSLVRKHLTNKRAKILDWGAYLGQITYLLQDDYNVNAYNPTENNDIKYWHEKLNIKLKSFGKEFEKFKLNFESESFDAVISSGVLEHTFEYGIEDVEALRNIHRILRPNGYLFIWNLPTKDALAEKIAMKKKRWKHILRYDLDDVLVKLNLSGFDIVEIEKNELFFTKLAKLLKFIPLPTVWQLDQLLCKLPIFEKYVHHFTIVAKKINNFPITPATSGYTTYIK